VVGTPEKWWSGLHKPNTVEKKLNPSFYNDIGKSEKKPQISVLGKSSPRD
jgi:hypothetical protein